MVRQKAEDTRPHQHTLPQPYAFYASLPQFSGRLSQNWHGHGAAAVECRIYRIITHNAAMYLAFMKMLSLAAYTTEDKYTICCVGICGRNVRMLANLNN